MTDTEPWSDLKPKGDCECGMDACTLFGTLGRPDKAGRRHVRGCAKHGCKVCQGRANKRKGQRKQAKATTALGIPRGSISAGHEEFLPGTLRVEVKAGGRVANPVWTRYRDCETQSEAQRPFGDHRPFAAVYMPDGQSDGLVVVRLSNVHEFAAAIVEQFEAAR